MSLPIRAFATCVSWLRFWVASGLLVCKIPASFKVVGHHASAQVEELESIISSVTTKAKVTAGGSQRLSLYYSFTIITKRAENELRTEVKLRCATTSQPAKHSARRAEGQRRETTRDDAGACCDEVNDEKPKLPEANQALMKTVADKDD